MLSFGMLVEEETSAFQYKDAPFLLRKHPLSIELATTLMLHEALQDADVDYDIVAFGKADFSDTEQDNIFRTVSSENGRLINLPAVADEIVAIADRFRNTLTQLNEKATEKDFLDLSGSAKILHIASHTLLRPASPLHNAIVLSKDPADDQSDGILYLHEIQQHALAAQLVVLSGCSTARGVLQPGEGMAGLQYAFRAMGVQSSLATSWFVVDEMAVPLMTSFYRNLQKGLTKDVALQRAQLAYLAEANDRTASPFFWAAPVLYGATDTIDLESRLFSKIFWISLILLLPVLLYLLYLRFVSTRP